MQLLTPLVPDPRAPLARANPVAKLGAALLLLVALFASLDGVTAADRPGRPPRARSRSPASRRAPSPAVPG